MFPAPNTLQPVQTRQREDKQDEEIQNGSTETDIKRYVNFQVLNAFCWRCCNS